jgi:serine/threonine protein kinase
MAGLGILIGQVLDGKYQLDRLLGQGGMGAVFLATHLGTKRPVALKVIAPQFMANEEVGERFRREAEAAGRLRHPNVVNVTDFGLAPVGRDRIAYLVMEYLDGCSLGEMLKKRGPLPLRFAVGIVEQICLAIGSAHRQGIIHRDLKPDNIWLQPDRRGSYIVKVLDFGLAKLRDTTATDSADESNGTAAGPETRALAARSADTVRAVAATNPHRLETAAREAATKVEPARQARTIAEEEKTAILDAQSTSLEAATQLQPADDSNNDRAGGMRDESVAASLSQPDVEEAEGATRIQAPGRSDDSNSHSSRSSASGASSSGSQLSSFGQSSSIELTRIGSVLGTPLYMSPEQCRSESLDARSDIYSLGVIVYQMLAGAPPFSGSMTELIAKHAEEAPPLLAEKRPDIPRSVAALVSSALEKDPAARPASAESFAAALRATAEGETELLRNAKTYYYTSQRVFMGLSALIYLPFAVFSLLSSFLVARAFSFSSAPVAVGFYLSIFLLAIFATRVSTASSTLAMRQLRANASARVSLKAILRATFSRLPSLASATAFSYASVLIGLVQFVIPGVRRYVDSALFPPVIALEGEKTRRALDRSARLVAPLRPIAAALQAREFGITLGSLVCFPFIMVIMAMIFGGSGRDSFEVLTVPAMRNFIVCYCWFLLMMMHTPYTAMPLAALYFKARQAQGEAEDESARGDLEQEEKRRRPARMTKATMAWFAIPVIMLAFLIAFPLIGGGESLIDMVRKGRQNEVKKLLAEGSNLNASRIGGTTALMYAAKDGHVGILKTLIEAGADFRIKDSAGDDALMYAAVDGRTDALRILIGAGADVNTNNRSGETPLIAAARRGRTETVRALVAAGADPAARDEKNKTALDYAEEEGYADAAQALRGAAAGR